MIKIQAYTIVALMGLSAMMATPASAALSSVVGDKIIARSIGKTTIKINKSVEAFKKFKAALDKAGEHGELSTALDEAVGPLQALSTLLKTYELQAKQGKLDPKVKAAFKAIVSGPSKVLFSAMFK